MFCEIYLNTYGLDPAVFHLEEGFSLIAARTMTKSQTTFLTDIGMLLVIATGIRDDIWHTVLWYAKSNNSYIKNYDKD